MLDYKNFINNSKRFKTLVYLPPKSFCILLKRFSKTYDQLAYKNTGRIRAKGAGRKSLSLYDTAQKLFFLLYYLRNYPTFENLGASFDLSTPVAFNWIKKLETILACSLSDQIKLSFSKECLDEGSSRTIIKQLAHFACDGTERQIRRPQKNQEDFYSGKKKTYCQKRPHS